MPTGRGDLQVLRLQPVGQLEQGRQVHCGLESDGHLRTAILIEHPGRHRLLLGSRELDVLHVLTAEFSHDREVVSPVKWMIRIPNRNFAPVAGIIRGRLAPA